MRELDHRNISFSDNMIVRDLKQKLRNNEKAQRKGKYEQIHECKARDSDVDLLHFHPLHQAATKWGDAYHDRE